MAMIPIYTAYIYKYIIMKEAMPCPAGYSPPQSFQRFLSGGSGAHIGPNCRRRASSCGIDDVNHRYLTIDGVNHRC